MRDPRVLLLVAAVALLAAASPVVKWLQVNRPLHLGEDAINFCNVLFVGNLLAGTVALTAHGPRRVLRSLSSTTARGRSWLAANAVLAIVIPTLIFIALGHTTVTNVILLGRFESVAFALLAARFLGQRIGPWQKAGYGTISVGVLAVVVLGSDLGIMRGDPLVIAAALVQGGAAIVAKRTLETVDRGAFLFVRNAASAVVFLVLGILLFGPHHFAHAFAGNLWIAMLAYAGLISFGGQWAWYRSIDTLPPSTISAVSTLSPLFGIGLAFLLLDEVPSAVQLSGAAIVLAGMALTRIRPPAGAPIHATVGRSLAGG